MKKVFAVGVALALLLGALSALLTLFPSNDTAAVTISNGASSVQSSSVQGSMFDRLKDSACEEYEVPNAAALAAFYETQPDIFAGDQQIIEEIDGYVSFPFYGTFVDYPVALLHDFFIPRSDGIVDGGAGYLVEISVGGDVSLKEQEGVAGTMSDNVVSINVEATTGRTFNSIRGRIGAFLPDTSVSGLQYVAVYQLNGEGGYYVFSESSPLSLTAISHYHEETLTVAFDDFTEFNYTTDDDVWDLYLSWKDAYKKCVPVETVTVSIFAVNGTEIVQNTFDTNGWTNIEGDYYMYNGSGYYHYVTKYPHGVLFEDADDFTAFSSDGGYGIFIGCETEYPHRPYGVVRNIYGDVVGYVTEDREIILQRDWNVNHSEV